MRIEHIEEIEALAREALGDDAKARLVTKAIVKAAEFWHQEAKEELATKADLHKELHSQSWRFAGVMGLMTAIILGAMYFLMSDIQNDMREIRTRLSAQSK
jgi:hypothetical protein